MAYFDKDFAAFFKDLEQNNEKEWFHANKKRYEKSVKEPYKAFTNDLVLALQEVYPDQNLADKFKIGRINRDIRFSADKTPYKDHMSTMVMPHGKGDYSRPGLYLQANHKDVRVYTGAHSLEKEQLQAVREHIVDNMAEFDALLNDATFKETFGEILGDKHKRLPAEFREAAEDQPLIFNKSFYWFFKLKPSVLTADDLIDQLISNFKKSLPMNRFFEKAMGV